MTRKLLLLAAVLLCVTYVGSYVVLSRRGYADADYYGFKGFYYFLPEDNGGWRLRNGFCVVVYWPVNKLDVAIGLGQYPAVEPTWGIE
jgi:hypothetical protein